MTAVDTFVFIIHFIYRFVTELFLLEMYFLARIMGNMISYVSYFQ